MKKHDINSFYIGELTTSVSDENLDTKRDNYIDLENGGAIPLDSMGITYNPDTGEYQETLLCLFVKQNSFIFCLNDQYVYPENRIKNIRPLKDYLPKFNYRMPKIITTATALNLYKKLFLDKSFNNNLSLYNSDILSDNPMICTGKVCICKSEQEKEGIKDINYVYKNTPEVLLYEKFFRDFIKYNSESDGKKIKNYIECPTILINLDYEYYLDLVTNQIYKFSDMNKGTNDIKIYDVDDYDSLEESKYLDNYIDNTSISSVVKNFRLRAISDQGEDKFERAKLSKRIRDYYKYRI